MADRDTGFTLIETLVALVLLGSVFAVLSSSFAGGMRGVRTARMDATATMLARAKLATAGTLSTLNDGQDAFGTDAGFEWRVSAKPYQRPDTDVRDTEPAAFWVTVDVSWREGAAQQLRSVQLKGLKLSRSP